MDYIDHLIAEYERLVALHRLEIGVDGYADEADPPATLEQPGFRDFFAACEYLLRRFPDNVLSGNVARVASHVMFEDLEGHPISDGAVILAALACDYSVIRPQEGGSGWLQRPKEANRADQ